MYVIRCAQLLIQHTHATHIRAATKLLYPLEYLCTRNNKNAHAYDLWQRVVGATGSRGIFSVILFLLFFGALLCDGPLDEMYPLGWMLSKRKSRLFNSPFSQTKGKNCLYKCCCCCGCSYTERVYGILRNMPECQVLTQLFSCFYYNYLFLIFSRAAIPLFRAYARARACFECLSVRWSRSHCVHVHSNLSSPSCLYINIIWLAGLVILLFAFVYASIYE